MNGIWSLIMIFDRIWTGYELWWWSFFDSIWTDYELWWYVLIAYELDMNYDVFFDSVWTEYELWWWFLIGFLIGDKWEYHECGKPGL